MLNIVKVQPTVGKAVIFAVVSNDSNYPDLHKHLLNWLESEYGKDSYFSYVESFACPDVDISSHKVQRFLNIDEIVANAE